MYQQGKFNLFSKYNFFTKVFVNINVQYFLFLQNIKCVNIQQNNIRDKSEQTTHKYW